jgi:hypothetical protein
MEYGLLAAPFFLVPLTLQPQEAGNIVAGLTEEALLTFDTALGRLGFVTAVAEWLADQEALTQGERDWRILAAAQAAAAVFDPSPHLFTIGTGWVAGC